MPNLYREESSNPRRNAQRNLAGRTHYVDDDTLRYHKSRILSARNTDVGLLFALVESVALDPQNTKRGYRYVIFDIFGDVVGTRADLEHAYKSSAAATKAMWAELSSIDAPLVTRDAIARETKHHADEMRSLAHLVARIENGTRLAHSPKQNATPA